MKTWAFAVGALAIGCATTTPAHAAFAVIQFENGSCQIWADGDATPWGPNWRKIAVGLPNWAAAAAALNDARVHGVCP